MTVFKSFWKVLLKYKGTIILYSMILIIFGAINMSTSDNNVNFEDSKPDILIVNNDKGNKVSDNLVKYISDNSNIIDNLKTKNEINDALFYRNVNYVICIPKNYGKDIMNGKNPEIDIKSTGDYQASLAEMMLKRYIQVQNIYKTGVSSEDEFIKLINNNLSKDAKIEITSKLDTTKVSNASTYFSFASYSIMAVIIFIICLVLSSFKEKTVNKRTIVSSMNYEKYNRDLLFASFGYSFVLWVFFILLGIIMLGDIMFTSRGLVYMLNSFIFTFCCLTIALFISTLVTNKNAVSGIVNVVALGSSFLCGAFVPAEWLPNSVLTFAHILPTYWYINSNDLLKTIEVIDFTSLHPIFINMLVVLGFSILFIILNNIISKYKQKVI